ncbi:Alb1-domain-containing protein [Podospora conica]|nr:Alb1-domain-containing protein [Schizothecium conicum]
MAKQRATSKHSRAARRATSPGIDTDKSLKHVKPPTDAKKPDVLAAHHSGGITKKKRKVVLSTKARKRQEKSMDRAEAVMDRTTTKVEKSKGSFRVIQSRKKTWDEINREALELVDPPLVVAAAAAAKKGKASKDKAGGEHVAKIRAGDDDADMKETEASVETGPAAAAPGLEPEWVDVEDEVL